MDLKSVPIRTNRFYQTRYVPQSCLQCTDAFHQTPGDINPLVDVLVDGLEWLLAPFSPVFPPFHHVETWQDFDRAIENMTLHKVVHIRVII